MFMTATEDLGRVLVVDDDDATRRAIEVLLRAEGFAASGAPDAEAALSEATRAPPDLVLTDVHMPGIQGVELCRRLHEIEADLPVIVMTAHSDMDTVIESLRAGAEDYLIKPLQSDVVVYCVKRVIARRRAKLEQRAIQRELNERLVVSCIREQELAEAEATQRAQLNALLASLSEGVVIAEPSGSVRLINDAARTILGLMDDQPTLGALHSLDVHDIEGRRLDDRERPLRRALGGQRFVDYEVMCTRPNGEQCRVSSAGTHVRNVDGSVALAIVVLRDVTEMRRLEQQRDEYLALVSHDLRNPLSVILGTISALKESVGTKAAALPDRAPLRFSVASADRAERNAKQMVTMLEELTEATSLEAKDPSLRRVACDLGDVVSGVVDNMDDARARRITIETADAPPHTVLADVPRLERVVGNLLTNALKYSAEDAHVSALLAHEGGEVTLAVTDRGIGIAPESVKRLFERYYRTPGGKARASGLGLGLYIARLMVEAHGGRIDVSSALGKGSTFKLTLPSHAVA
jgi:two-component system phosphate regulon sensor histidine kinase PhoR